VPFTLDHNRMIVEVQLIRPDGSVRKVAAWVDTGNESLILTEAVARDVGVEVPTPGKDQEHGSVRSASPAPGVRFGGMTLDVTGIPTLVRRGSRVNPGVPAEVHLPASALRHDHVVLDYPARRLTVARAGALAPRGVAVPCGVNPTTGLFQVAATLDGETVQLGVDNGSSGTWISETLTAAWRTRHPDWPQTTGAVGSANFFGFGFEARGALMRLPEIAIGPMRAAGVAVLGLDQRLFDWYSTKSAASVAGFIGANVLREFRVEVDYPNEMTYWEPGPRSTGDDLNIVGLTLSPEADGSFTVAGVAARDRKPTVDGVHPGDTLLRVDELDVNGATMGAVTDALRGKPGASRTLVVEQGGKHLRVDARVTRFP
jgi:hypothetical protein